MTASDTVQAVPHPGLLAWLADHEVEYQLREHPLTITARETARVEGIDPRRFAKTLGVATADGSRALMVIDALDRLDLVLARRVLDTHSVRLLDEAELQKLAPDCEVGTIPPVGDLFGVRVCADFAIRDDPEITFHAGSHRFTVTVERSSWEKAAHVTYANLAVDVDRGPAWMRS